VQKDKRGWIRLITSTLVHFVSERNRWVGTLTDISPGGMQCDFHTTPAGKMSEDDAFECVFVLPTGKVEGTCRVEWIDWKKRSVGASFEQLGPVSREAVESYCQSPF
jgi:hypothetical protein